ncbi:ArnT family glycosyltransferase [Aquisphaera insulae]|uniref:ArnT family glycosyltransferase n=1 Tax=Aquisphaera insulae TaxID=2712864 RepID=UPI0020308D11|nr:glycosyltransferase family 39 protein [Aquisphaera insulae]
MDMRVPVVRALDWRLVCLVVATLGIRLALPGQPIVENYVGRQIPTAMVARNLDRGAGFFYPSLSTAPFPNYFVVEPPVYQALAVGVHRIVGVGLEAAGRGVSAVATGLAAVGLWGLVRRRQGRTAAVVALVAFGAFPVTIRYGRAFQPDALMLGGVLAGLECADRAVRGAGRRWWALAWIALAIGIAAKVTGAFVFVPLVVVVAAGRRRAALALAAAALLPAACWYLWVPRLIELSGSRAAADNRTIWMAVLGLSALARPETLRQIGRFLLIRAFSPLGVLLGTIGLVVGPAADRGGDVRAVRWDLWRVWSLAAMSMLALLGAKLHHEYYWLIMAPAFAAGIGRLWGLAASWRVLTILCLLACAYFARSTWQTPEEWAGLEEAAAEIKEVVPSGVWLVAVEPLLYESDRVGCRLERTPSAAARAAAEWPGTAPRDRLGPEELVEFYRTRGARFVADLKGGARDEDRDALHRAIRRRYKVLRDTPSVLIAELKPSEGSVTGGEVE